MKLNKQLHVSSRDISSTKKRYEEEQNTKQLQSEVHPGVTEQHKDQKSEAGTVAQVNRDTQQDGIYEMLTKINKKLIEEKEVLDNIIFSQRQEIQELKGELKQASFKRRSGHIPVKTELLYDEVRFLLNRDAEYCYLVYEDNQLTRLVDALEYEDDLTPKQETNNKLQFQNDGSIY